MERERLIVDVRETLSRAGFCLTAGDVRTVVFDILARRDGLLIIAKVLVNIDGLTRSVALELRLLAQYLGASPLVIGGRTSLAPLDDGTLYTRHELPIVNLQSLVEYFIQGVPPFVFAAPGGPYVRINGVELSRLRQEKGLSLGALAEAAGVSRKAIQLYESGRGAVVDVAMRLEEFLGAPIVSPVDILASEAEPVRERPVPVQAAKAFTGFQKTVFERLGVLGFEVVPTVRSPFAALSAQPRKEPAAPLTVVLTGVSPESQPTPNEGRILHAMARVAEQEGVIIQRKPGTRPHLEGTPVLAQEELGRLGGHEEVIDLIRERRAPRL